ncbi:regulatory iron-sulfur-containing complex subunit RicT [uncultured Bacteroides sp.]|uniref:regulatory iron-sulfur-containing complex subunit RicT n=1 Tax=uncultured Bacteroides sp. TaxID=162156 RepID=UPI002603C72F|nr:regulatory iron-sulfur-containing complex subunit RicT [uncultured Bacteroides sp.]
MTDFKLHNGNGSLCRRSCGRQDKQLNTYDWLADIPGNAEESEYVEIQFKNTRKGYYRNSNKIPLEKGDIVAVEAAPGHDIGVVTLTGRLVPLQMRKANIRSEADIKRIYRKAKPVDMEKYNEAKAREHSTMIRARQIALDLKLEMKIGDVEYQGDGNKAIFYYIADERVDFRQLIKVLAEVFRVRIEMKQIGARQEAGRIGGIGPCGRELCCATWMTSFVSVSTSAARFQDISLNPQKLAGQCAKLKCCLNYEVDCYVEAQKRLPSKEIELETKDGVFYFFKADILSNQVTYSTDKTIPANLVTISGRRAFEIIGMNKRGIKPESLTEETQHTESKKSADLLEQESVTRFDRNRKGKGDGENKETGGNGRSKKKKKANANRPQGNGQNAAPQAQEQQPNKEQGKEQQPKPAKEANKRKQEPPKQNGGEQQRARQPKREQQTQNEQQPRRAQQTQGQGEEAAGQEQRNGRKNNQRNNRPKPQPAEKPNNNEKTAQE